ncbi:MAG: hypothetical protein LBG73_03345 [Spirochaetaceae bacterium]|jgi:Na+-transporting NADH:ubiquinone oxidoreductase subunit NqrF|nr:hypothetical protein [Spirochaetaceae bacterium]
MKKRIVLGALILALVSVFAFAASGEIKNVKWTWEVNDDLIYVTNRDKADHTLNLAVSIKSGTAGYESCVNAEIDVKAGKSATWNVKERIGRSASIIGVSTTTCK